MITTRGRYALRIMIELAQVKDGSYLSLREVAKRQKLSSKYLESIMRGLVKANLVKVKKGRGGGYKLAHEASVYTVRSILEVEEKSLAAVVCLRQASNPCKSAATCKTLPMWEEYKKLTEDYFASKKLIDFVD